MRKDKKINEERLLGEGKNIYKYSFCILICLVFVDIMIKFNLYSFIEKPGYMWYLFGVEALFLVVAFYFNLFANASKGILMGSTNSSITKFPWKRYVLLSVGLASIIATGLYVIRWFIGHNEYGWGGVFLMFLIWLGAFIFFSAILLISFFIAYRVVLNINKRVKK